MGLKVLTLILDRNSTGNDTGSDSESESETSEDGHDSISDDIVSVHDQVSDNDSGKPTEIKGPFAYECVTYIVISPLV